MFKKIVLIICVLLFVCCKTYDLQGETYTAENEEKSVAIKFINDTLCIVNQQFFCADLPQKYKQTEITAEYRIEKLKIKGYNENYKPKTLKTNVLILDNIDCEGECAKYQEIPNYESLGCLRANVDERIKGKVVFGKIYNLAKDTFELKKNQIKFANLNLEQQ